MEMMKTIEIVETVENSAVKKSEYSFWQTFLLAILAGIFIGFGGIFSTIAQSNVVGAVPFGVTKILAGLAFSLGLILVVLAGAELFTGNTMLSLAVYKKKVSFWKLSKNWLIVYLGNFVGALILAVLIVGAKHYAFGNGLLGQTMLNIAIHKMHLGFLQAICLGILCNILVCLAVFMAMGARTASGKILCILFPITAFIAMSFEHSVANMYLIPVVLFVKKAAPDFVLGTGLNLVDITWWSFLFKNLLPVTIGNIIGGCFVWLIYGRIYDKK